MEPKETMKSGTKLGGQGLVFRIPLVILMASALLLASTSHAQGTTADWQERVRVCVAVHDLSAALKIVDARLIEASQDPEAREWRARLLAQVGRWNESEMEYRGILEAAPRNVDVFVGLSYVLAWQRHFEDAIAVLQRAGEIDPTRADIYVSRGRAFRAMGDLKQARIAFKKALMLQASDKEAEAGLASLVAVPRFTLSFGTDIDAFNFAGTGHSLTTSLVAQISPKWVAAVSGVGQSRSGEKAETFLSSVGYRLTRRDSIMVGGGFANAQAIVPTRNVFFEYSRGFSLGEGGFLRGVETSYRQQWYWYEGAQLMTLTPRLTLDMPGEWSWSMQVTEAKSNFTGFGAEWRPSGITRLNFPIHQALSGNIFYAMGTEDFAVADQIGNFSAMTGGAGLSYWWRKRHHLTAYVARQGRSQGRTQTSYGVNYAIHF